MDIKKRKIENIDRFSGDQWQLLKGWSKKSYLFLKWNPHGQGFLVDYNSYTDSFCLNLINFLKQKTTTLSLPLPSALKNELSLKSNLHITVVNVLYKIYISTTKTAD